MDISMRLTVKDLPMNEHVSFQIKKRPNNFFKPYDIADYEQEIGTIDEQGLDTNQIGAYKSHATKKLKSGVTLKFVIKIAHKENLDITPVMALRLIKKLSGKGICKQILLKAFAVPGRKANNKTQDIKAVEALVAKYKDEFQQFKAAEFAKVNKIKPICHLPKKRKEHNPED